MTYVTLTPAAQRQVEKYKVIPSCGNCDFWGTDRIFPLGHCRVYDVSTHHRLVCSDWSLD